MNQIVVSGRIGQDPVMNYTESGKAVTKFSLAVDSWSKDGGSSTTWFNVECWESTAENVYKYCNKGKYVMVSGSVKSSQYKSAKLIDFMVKNGIPRDKAEIASLSTWFSVTASRVEFVPDQKPKSTNIEEIPEIDLDEGPF